MATKEDILNYVERTPENTNRAVLSTLIDSYGGGGGEGVPVLIITEDQLISTEPVTILLTEEQRGYAESNDYPQIVFDATVLGPEFPKFLLTACRVDIEEDDVHQYTFTGEGYASMSQGIPTYYSVCLDYDSVPGTESYGCLTLSSMESTYKVLSVSFHDNRRHLVFEPGNEQGDDSLVDWEIYPVTNVTFTPNEDGSGKYSSDENPSNIYGKAYSLDTRVKAIVCGTDGTGVADGEIHAIEKSDGSKLIYVVTLVENSDGSIGYKPYLKNSQNGSADEWEVVE